MDIYIRSQTSLSVHKLNCRLYVKYKNNTHIIMCGDNAVAVYESKERCIEIIDEICRMARLSEKDFIIYNMPQE